MKHIALITGASSGVGREFVRQLDAGVAGEIDELWLIARSRDALMEVAKSCSTPTKVMPLDLCDPASFEAITKALDTEDEPDVRWLINSAGFGKFGEFGEIGIYANENMVRLNCLAIVDMCHLALRHMHAGSRVINMASAASFVPQPWLSTYAATKSFVLSFTQALDYELASVDIHACAVCPKFMDTGFLDRPGNADWVRHTTWIGFEEPHLVVTKAIHAAKRGKSICISSPDMKVAHAVCKVLPTTALIGMQDMIGTLLASRMRR